MMGNIMCRIPGRSLNDVKGKRSHDTAIMWTNYQKGQQSEKQESLGWRLKSSSTPTETGMEPISKGLRTLSFDSKYTTR
jgi:hypothetical protein